MGMFGNDLEGVYIDDQKERDKDNIKKEEQAAADKAADDARRESTRVNITKSMSSLQGAAQNDMDSLNQVRLGPELREGESAGIKLTGLAAAELGARNRQLSNQIFSDMDKPSIGANRLAEQGAARLSQMVSQQAQQGVTGGLAQAQRMQLQRQTDRDVAGQTQKDYENAVSRAGAKQISDAGTFSTLMGSGGELAMAKQMETKSSGGGSYLCTELHERGLVSKWELVRLHIMMFLSLLTHPSQILFYLQWGDILRSRMKQDPNVDWAEVKKDLVDDSLSSLYFWEARRNYSHVVAGYFSHYFFGNAGMKREIDLLLHGGKDTSKGKSVLSAIRMFTFNKI